MAWSSNAMRVLKRAGELDCQDPGVNLPPILTPKKSSFANGVSYTVVPAP